MIFDFSGFVWVVKSCKVFGGFDIVFISMIDYLLFLFCFKFLPGITYL